MVAHRSSLRTPLVAAPQYVPLAMPVDEVPTSSKIIVFSQGMSPNAHPYIERAAVLFTGTTSFHTRLFVDTRTGSAHPDRVSLFFF